MTGGAPDHHGRRSRIVHDAVHSRFVRRGTALFLPAAAALTLAAFLIVVAVQQDLRIGANDLPQQLAEDGARALDDGASPAAVAGAGAVPIDSSLAPFIAIYDAAGSLLATDGSLDDRPPSIPIGVLHAARATGRDAVTWQPREGVRVALVVVPWQGGTIAAGRSLRLIESRIDAIQLLIVLGWLAGLAALAVAAAVAGWLWPTNRRPTSGRGDGPQPGQPDQPTSGSPGR
jgi:hypothetical protein